MERPDFFTLKNGDKAKLPFTDQEYQRRLTNLRTVMSKNNLDMIILTSMHNIAYIQASSIVLLADLMDVL